MQLSGKQPIFILSLQHAICYICAYHCSVPHTNCNAYQSRFSDQGICRLENSQRLIQYLSGEGPAAPCSYQGAECAGDLYAQNSMGH